MYEGSSTLYEGSSTLYEGSSTPYDGGAPAPAGGGFAHEWSAEGGAVDAIAAAGSTLGGGGLGGSGFSDRFYERSVPPFTADGSSSGGGGGGGGDAESTQLADLTASLARDRDLLERDRDLFGADPYGAGFSVEGSEGGFTPPSFTPPSSDGEAEPKPADLGRSRPIDLTRA